MHTAPLSLRDRSPPVYSPLPAALKDADHRRPTAPVAWVAVLVAIVVAELAVWFWVLLPWNAHATRHWNHSVGSRVAVLLLAGSVVLAVLAVLVFSPLSTSFFMLLDHNSLKDPDDYGVYRRRGLFRP